MVGKFQIYPVSKRLIKSKSGKTEYWFANGIQVKGQPDALLDRGQCFNFWAEAELPDLKFMQPVEALCDVNGNFVKVLEVFGVKNMAPDFLTESSYEEDKPKPKKSA